MSWSTLESDAGVFTDLIENLGVKDVQVDELYCLDVETLQQFQKIYGIIFLFKWKKQADNFDGELDYASLDELYFPQQIISNACATQALMSILLNHTNEIDIGNDLREFYDFTKELPADLKGEALGNSELIRCVHNSFARADPFISDESRPATDDDDVYHFIAYTLINDKLYELDGLQPAPICHGKCEKPLFASRVVPVIQSRIAKYPPNEIRFNLMVLSPDRRRIIQQDPSLSDTEKTAILAVEEEKRARWKRENQLRKHNFVGMFLELLKLSVKDQIDKGTWNETLQQRIQSHTQNQLEKRNA
ncbi:ubiquitin carboxy terminal hydrolase Uch2 [Schizosaccharomyces japonicus yFS275]|uniref:Ubiquitin carboxyl-terminal hydrolase n=1 Tax=Schizosaccharomyces japonicus (strain yFS275 / FY16936) TaxID=402676 RepID=B6K275_SCHJY|nr:ubiquitin carboxy terminal hydrolase Uch2 [Schizosaccharomyces japonicus yFS275]EEB07256.1 ubiquitin carboxy terminal hydrolase Uch2 [Schizosaccharomyces japonicus yFS275]